MQRLLVSLLTAIIVVSVQSPVSAQYDWTFDPGNPLMSDGSGRLLEPSILYDADRNQFDLWYSDGQSVRRAVSSDGRTWNLSGSYQSLTSLFGVPFCYGVEIVKIGSTYYMYGSCQSSDYNSYYVALATSADGNTWTKHPSSPALTPRGSGSWENTYIMYPKVVQHNGVYYLYYQGDGSPAEIGLATSTDGVHWEEFEGNPVIRIQDAGASAAGVAPSGLENVNGMFYMLMNTADNALHASTNLMTSSDGISWSYYPGNPVLTTGAPGTWNGGWIGNGTLRHVHGKYWYWFCATDTRPNEGSQAFRMGLATSGGDDRDGFWHHTSGPGVDQDIRSFASNSEGVLFAGTWTAGEVYKTTNNGDTWTVCGAIPNTNPVLGLAVDHHDHIFASVYLRGMARSTDNGVSWEWKNNGLTNQATRLTLVDRQGNIWVSSEGGVFCSTNDGENWTNKKPGFFGYLLMDSTGAVIAREEDRTGNSILHRSTDGGASWSSTANPGIGVGAVHPDGSYWANSYEGSEIFRSTDHGVTWTDMHSPVSWTGLTAWLMTMPRGDIFYSLHGTGTGVLRSTDNGETWQVTNDGLTTTNVIVMYPHPSGYVFLGTYTDGVFRSSQSYIPQEISVSVPDVVTAAGTTFEIPVNVTNLSGSGILAYDFTMEFNSPDSIVSVDATPITAGTLSGRNGWSVLVNTTASSQIQVAAYGATPLAGEGVLLKLTVSTSALAVAGDSTGLAFTKFIFNAGNPVPALHDGGLTIRERVCGDADENGTIQSYDAALTLREALGPMSSPPPPLTAVGRLNADVSKNGKVEAYDAALILRHVVGLAMPESTVTCFESGGDSPSAPKSIALSANVMGIEQDGGQVSVRLQLSNVPPAMAVYSCAFELTASATAGDSVALALPILPEGSLATVHRLGNGQFRVGIVDPYGLDVADLALTISAGHSASLNEITFSELFLNDVSGGSIALRNVITAIHPEAPVSRQPGTYNLIGAYPNPFNPSTRIVFENPASAPVRLEIYNAQGARVKVLCDEPVGAGRHEAFWDGTSSSGQTVASGEYFCVMRSGAFVKSLRLLLLK